MDQNKNKMNAVILDGYTTNSGDLSWGTLGEVCNLKIYDTTPKEEIVKRAIEADIIISNKCHLSKEILGQLPNLKYISLLSTGTNLVDIEYTNKNKILVSNAPNYSTQMVAQHTFALILDLINQVRYHSDRVKQSEWESAQDSKLRALPILELSNKTIGIIGYGKIGREVAKIAKAFNMHVLGYSRNGFSDINATSVGIQELLTKSDIVSLHCPFNAQTDKLINKKSLQIMKSSAYLINTARGAIIDENDLYIALKSGKIRAAGLDVLSNEPPVSNMLLELDNCIITPHIAWAGAETRARLLKIAIDNVINFVEGKPQNLVT